MWVQILDESRDSALVQIVFSGQNLQETGEHGGSNAIFIRVLSDCFDKQTGIYVSLLGWDK